MKLTNSDVREQLRRNNYDCSLVVIHFIFQFQDTFLDHCLFYSYSIDLMSILTAFNEYVGPRKSFQ